MQQARFVSLWDRCIEDNKTSKAETIYHELERLYAQPARLYHNLNHIAACLGHLDAVRDLLSEVDAVEAALWFHDAIYDPTAGDNELRSAQLFLGVAGGQVSARFAERVYDLIMMTLHPSNPEDLDEKFIVDIDLSSFGLPWREFIRLGDLIRKESTHLTDEDFEAEQLRFLELLVQRPSFFATKFFRERYEHIAQDNLARKIEYLRARTV